MTNIFVGNLDFGTRESDIRNAFERFGHVSSVRIITEPSTNRSRGFGFVQMPSLDDADDAIKRMSGSTLNGRQIVVNEATDSPGRGERQVGVGGSSARSAAIAMFESLLEE